MSETLSKTDKFLLDAKEFSVEYAKKVVVLINIHNEKDLKIVDNEKAVGIFTEHGYMVLATYDNGQEIEN